MSDDIKYDNFVMPPIGNRQRRKGLKLTPEDVAEIHKLLWFTDLTQQEIAEKFNVSTMLISKIARGKVWKRVAAKEVPGPWRRFLPEDIQDLE